VYLGAAAVLLYTISVQVVTVAMIDSQAPAHLFGTELPLSPP
jgi:hypothetical protein